MAEFFHMGGYALYVWGSFGVTALLMIAEPLLLRGRSRRRQDTNDSVSW
jgi:heme exporter protein D